MSAPLLPDLVTRYYTDKAAAENAILIWASHKRTYIAVQRSQDRTGPHASVADTELLAFADAIKAARMQPIGDADILAAKERELRSHT